MILAHSWFDVWVTLACAAGGIALYLLAWGTYEIRKGKR